MSFLHIVWPQNCMHAFSVQLCIHASMHTIMHNLHVLTSVEEYLLVWMHVCVCVHACVCMDASMRDTYHIILGFLQRHFMHPVAVSFLSTSTQWLPSKYLLCFLETPTYEIKPSLLFLNALVPTIAVWTLQYVVNEALTFIYVLCNLDCCRSL